MEGPDRPIWFAGDLGDPWVASIAGALPRGTPRIDCPGNLPELWPADGPSPGVLVLHRASLDATDAQRLTRLRGRAEGPPRVVLCLGPHARHVDLERWARLVDAVIPEATARETVARHALALDRPIPDRAGRSDPRIAVVSTNFELRATLAESCRAGRYTPEPAFDWGDARPGLPAVWDVPVLEPAWPAALALRAASAPVIALLGFADRATVRLAREHGASACLELPFELPDLLGALDRVVHRPHGVPPAPLGLRPPGGGQGRRRGRKPGRGVRSAGS